MNLFGLIEDNDRLCELSDLVDVNDNCVFEVKQKVSKWMILHAGIDGNSSTSRRTKSSRKSQTSHHSLSTKSSGSQRSNICQKSKIVGLKAEIEALKRSEEAKIEAKMIKMKVKAESFKMAQEAKLKAEVIRLEGKIAKEEAIEKVQVEEEKIKIKRHGILDEGLLNDSDFKNASRHQQLADLLKIQSAPNVEIDIFSGDPLEYNYFITNFKDVVETLVDDQRGWLTRLIKYTSGEAKELIKHCVHDNPNSCYERAVQLLDREYGDPFKTACAYIERLRDWPMLKYNDAGALKGLYRFLLRCQTYQKKGYLEVLNSPLTIRNIQLKLPVNQQDKWAQLVGKIRRKKKREATLCDFVSFIETETINMNDAVYSRSGIRDVMKYKMKTSVTQYEVDNVKVEKCPLCEMMHDLDDCSQFLQKDLSTKRKFLSEHRLCFACYGTDHVAKACEKKRM